MDGVWYRDASVWAALEPILFSARNRASAPAAAAQIERLCDLAAGSRILDVGCGVGRHSLALARLGHRVTGIDLTEGYIRKARQAAADVTPAPVFAVADMYGYRDPGAFDLAVCLSSSFGYARDPADDEILLGNLRASLVDGGRVLIQTTGREILERVFQERFTRQVDGYEVVHEQRLEDGGAWIAARWTITKGDARHEAELGHRVYGAEELVPLLGAAGFGEVRAFGALDGTPYGADAAQLVVVGVSGGNP